MNTHSLDLELSSSQYAYITDAAQSGLDLTGDCSFEAWIKLEQLPSVAGKPMMIVTKDNNTTQRSYDFFIHSASAPNGYPDKLSVSFSSDNGTHWTSVYANYSFGAGDIGKWIHVAAVIDVSVPSVTFYIDGEVVDGYVAGTDATSIYNSTTDFAVGCQKSTTPANYLNGKIDEVRVWSDIRTQQEIQDNMRNELVGNEANLVGYWKFNNDYLDATANNNDLTAVNSPVFSDDVPFGVKTINDLAIASVKAIGG